MENKDFTIVKSIHLNNNAEVERIENEVLTRIEEIREQGRVIGDGSTARVFICESDPGICYKIITNDRVFRISTEQEMKLQDSALKHARVPKPLFCIRGKNIEALVMERIKGHTLQEIMEDDAELPEKFRFETAFKEIGQFVRKLNVNRIYHRDLAEKNIMIDEEGEPWIIDFGKSARAFNEEEAYRSDIINFTSRRYETVSFTNDENNLPEIEKKLKKYLINKGKSSANT